MQRKAKNSLDDRFPAEPYSSTTTDSSVVKWFDQTFILLSFHTEPPRQAYFSLRISDALTKTLLSSGERD